MRVIILSFVLVFLADGQNDFKLKNEHFIPQTQKNLGKFTIENSDLVKNGNFISKIFPYIVGGTEVSPPHKYPYLVAVYIDQMTLCGGILISDEWVLSVAHCVANTISSIIVEMGAHNVSDNEPTQVADETFVYFVHENFSPINSLNDIALIKLPVPVSFTDAIRNISLPSSSDVDLEGGELVTITGWGTFEGKVSSIPYEAIVSTISSADCSVSDSLFCTSGDFGVGTCGPDAGGPVIYETANGPQLRGIIMSVGCGNGNPSIHTRVTHYLDWIKANTGIV